MSDVERLQNEFRDVESSARLLPWFDDNPWAVSTHVWFEHEIPVIDLHGLSAKLGKKLLRKLVRTSKSIESGACIIITGQGAHSLGEPALRKIAISVLGEAATDKGWGLHSRGPGRLVLIIDSDKAPRNATGQLSSVFWWSSIVFFGLLIFFMARSCYL